MPERRTEVVIDLSIGNVEVSRPVQIPAQVQAEPGGGGRGRRPGARTTRGVPDVLTALYGGRFSARTMAAVRVVKAALAAITKAGPIAWAAVIAVGAATIGLAIQFYMAYKAARLFVTLLIGGFKILLGLGVSLAGIIMNLAGRAIRAAISMVQRLATELVNLAKVGFRYVTNFVKDSVVAFADFQQSARNVLSVMGKFGAESDAALQPLMNNLTAITEGMRTTAAEAAGAAYEVASAGWNTLADVLSVTRSSLVLAEATLSDSTKTATTLTAALKQFQLGGDQAARVANIFAAAIAQSPAQMDDLTSSLRYAGPAAHSFGITIEETIAALEGLYEQGLKGSLAGTALRSMFNAVAKQTPKAVKVLKALGLNLAEISPGRVGIIGLVRAFEQLRDRIGQLRATEVIFQVFPQRAATALLTLLNIGSQRLTEFKRRLTGTNTAFQMQADQLRTVAGQWGVLKNLWATVKNIVGGALAPGLALLTQTILDIVKAARDSGVLQAFGAALGNAAAFIAGFLRAMAPTILAAVVRWVNMLPDIFERLIGTVRQLWPSFIKLVQSLLDLGPVIVTSLLPALLQLAVVALPLLGQFVEQVLPKLIGPLTSLLTLLAEKGERGGELLAQGLRWAFAAAERLAAFLPVLWQTLQPLIPSFLQLANTLMDFFNVAAGSGLPVLQALVNLGVTILNIYNQWAGVLGQLLPTAIQAATVALNVLSAVIWAIYGAVGQFLPQAEQIIIWARDNLPSAIAKGLEAAGEFFVMLRGLVIVLKYLGQAAGYDIAILNTFFALLVTGALAGAWAIAKLGYLQAALRNLIHPTEENAAAMARWANNVNDVQIAMKGLWAGVAALWAIPSALGTGANVLQDMLDKMDQMAGVGGAAARGAGPSPTGYAPGPIAPTGYTPGQQQPAPVQVSWRCPDCQKQDMLQLVEARDRSLYYTRRLGGPGLIPA